MLARNALLRAVLGPSVGPRTSFARFMFLDPAARERIINWTGFAQATVAALRREAGRRPHDRRQQLTRGGYEAAFGELDRRIRWQDGVLAVNIIRQWRREVPVGGRGLTLVPGLFTLFPHLPVDTGDPPVLGLVSRARVGRVVLYRRTPAGTDLVSGRSG
jgi:hypothetical protein